MEQTANLVEDVAQANQVGWRPLGGLAASLVAQAAQRRQETEEADAAYPPAYAWAAE